MSPTPVVQVRRTFAASPETIFRAFTDPALISQWFARAPNMKPGAVHEADVRPGGRYLIEVVGPEDGLVYRMTGTYREVTPPTRLSFTWSYDRATFAPSVVTIDCREVPGGRTELTLTHELLPADQIEPHRQGWVECLEALSQVVESGANSGK